MSPRPRRKSKRRKRSRLGRLVEGLGIVVLLLIVLAFGLSIAARYEGQPERIYVRTGTQERAPSASAHGAPTSSNPVPAGLTEVPSRGTVVVEVRNGCGRTGLAVEMTRTLRAAGFDVVEWRDADHYDYGETLVVDRKGKDEAAARVCAFLQGTFGVGRVEFRPAEVAEADVLVILGSDLPQPLVPRVEAAPTGR